MLCIIRSKACPKCGGNLSLESDIYGAYIQCLQCGANWSSRDISLFSRKDIEKAIKAVRPVAARVASRRR